MFVDEEKTKRSEAYALVIVPIHRAWGLEMIKFDFGRVFIKI